MSFSRKFKRAKQKLEIKKAKLKIKKIESSINNLQKKCKVCEIPFDQSDKSLLDSWMVRADELGAALFCPNCFMETQENER